MRIAVLIVGGLLLLAIGFGAGMFAPSFWAKPRQSHGVAELDQEKFKKDWLYPGAGQGGLGYQFSRGNAILWAQPIITRSVYYHYTAPASFDKVVVFYEDRLSKHLGLAADERPKFTVENEPPWNTFVWEKSPGQYEYTIFVNTDPNGKNGLKHAQEATFSVRAMGAANPQEDRHGRSFTIFVRRTSDANRTDVSLIYDWETK